MNLDAVIKYCAAAVAAGLMQGCCVWPDEEPHDTFTIEFVRHDSVIITRLDFVESGRSLAVNSGKASVSLNPASGASTFVIHYKDGSGRVSLESTARMAHNGCDNSLVREYETRVISHDFKNVWLSKADSYQSAGMIIEK